MTGTTLSKDDERLLAQWLSGSETPDETLSLTAVKGLLFAVVAAPEPIATEDWLDVIFGGAAPADMADDKLFAIIALHNVISEQVYETGAQLPVECKVSEVSEACFNTDHPLNEWAIGFALGAAFYYQQLLDAIPETSEIATILQTAYLSLSYFACAETAQEIAALQQANFQDFNVSIFDMLADFVTAYAQVIEQAAMATGNFDDESWDDEELDD